MTAIGAYLGTTPASLYAYQQWLGRSVDQVLVSLNQNSWDAFDGSIWYEAGQWQPTGKPIEWSVPLTVSGTSLEQTATGAYNNHYYSAAQAALSSAPAGSSPIYIRLGWEFNIWQPWSSVGHEQAFVQTFQDAVNVFRSVSSRFKFVWDVNIGGSYNPAQAYPGDGYVDVIGMDGYYQKEWDSADPNVAFNQFKSEAYGLQWQQDFAAQHGKPTALSEWGTDADQAGPFIKALKAWMDQHNMLYENYWESNNFFQDELHEGQYPNAALAFQQTFGPSSTSSGSSGPAPSSGSVNVTGLSASAGAVIVDLPGGRVTQNGALVSTFSNATAVQAGAALTTVYGLKYGSSDTVVGGSGTLKVYGQGGNDTVTSGTGNATIFGATGAESFTSGGGQNIMYGGTGTNSMTGGAGAGSSDVFYGQGGTDTITGRGGAVTVYAGSGRTTLTGGSGTSTIYTGANTNTVNGGSGTNIIYGGTGSQAGTDIIYAGSGLNVLHEGSGTDYFASNAGACTIYGGSGQSYVYGGTGSQSIYAGAGNQSVSCGGGTTAFFETTGSLRAGRWDQIDGYWGAKATDIYMPTSVKGSTWFSALNGGTDIVTSVSGGVSQLFVSGTDVGTVMAHTHFTA